MTHGTRINTDSVHCHSSQHGQTHLTSFPSYRPSISEDHDVLCYEQLVGSLVCSLVTVPSGYWYRIWHRAPVQDPSLRASHTQNHL